MLQNYVFALLFCDFPSNFYFPKLEECFRYLQCWVKVIFNASVATWSKTLNIWVAKYSKLHFHNTFHFLLNYYFYVSHDYNIFTKTFHKVRRMDLNAIWAVEVRIWIDFANFEYLRKSHGKESFKIEFWYYFCHSPSIVHFYIYRTIPIVFQTDFRKLEEYFWYLQRARKVIIDDSSASRNKTLGIWILKCSKLG